MRPVHTLTTTAGLAIVLSMIASGGEVSVDFSSRGAGAAGGAVAEVVATGVGSDPESALQNAFSHAIEQAVGVLVDAETIVKNDKLVRDEILTHSRGYVERHEVVVRWTADGLHHCRVRARVAATKLAEKLEASRIALRDLPGERWYLEIMHRFKTEANAAKMLENVLREYTLDRLFKCEVRQPQTVEQDTTHAKLRISASLVPDMENWEKFRQHIMPLLDRFKSAHEVIEVRSASSDYGGERPEQLLGGKATSPSHRGASPSVFDMGKRYRKSSLTVLLLKNISRGGGRSEWDAYVVPLSLASPLENVLDQEYRPVFALADATGRTLLSANDERSIGGAYAARKTSVFGAERQHQYWAAHRAEVYYTDRKDGGHKIHTCYWLAPLLWCRWPGGYDNTGPTYHRSFELQHVLSIDLEKLKLVKKCAVELREATREPH